MPQGRSRQGPKVVGEREFMYNGSSDVHSNGMSEMGFPKGYQDHLSNPVLTHTDGKVRPLYGSSTDGDFVTKTETIVEYVRVPVGTTLVPSHNQAPKVQTDTGRPYKTAPISNLNWWRKPNYNAIGGMHDYGLPAANTGLNNYPRPQDSGKMRQHYNNPFGRNMVPNGNESTATTTDGRAMSTSSMEAPPKGIPLTKPTNIVETDHFKDATVLVARPQAYVLPPVVSQANVSLPTIDSREAELRYGGLLTFPVEAYLPAIDSREAAWKYRGEVPPVIRFHFQGAVLTHGQGAYLHLSDAICLAFKSSGGLGGVSVIIGGIAQSDYRFVFDVGTNKTVAFAREECRTAETR